MAEEHINFKACNKRIIEDYAIINANLPIIKVPLDDILNLWLKNINIL